MYQDFEDAWNHRHFVIFNQEQLEEIKRINFETFEQMNTAVIRSMPEFIQGGYNDEIMFDDTEPDLNLFQRIRGPIWVNYPTESDIQVSQVHLFTVLKYFIS